MVYLKMNGERVRSLRASTSPASTVACAAGRNRQQTRAEMIAPRFVECYCEEGLPKLLKQEGRTSGIIGLEVPLLESGAFYSWRWPCSWFS